MYNIKLRKNTSGFTVLNLINTLLEGAADGTIDLNMPFTICGDDNSYIHVTDNGLICIDAEDLEEVYAEYPDEDLDLPEGQVIADTNPNNLTEYKPADFGINPDRISNDAIIAFSGATRVFDEAATGKRLSGIALNIRYMTIDAVSNHISELLTTALGRSVNTGEIFMITLDLTDTEGWAAIVCHNDIVYHVDFGNKTVEAVNDPSYYIQGFLDPIEGADPTITLECTECTHNFDVKFTSLILSDVNVGETVLVPNSARCPNCKGIFPKA